MKIYDLKSHGGGNDMEIESIRSSTNVQVDSNATNKAESVSQVQGDADNTGKDAGNQNNVNSNRKDPTKTTIDSAFSDMNSKIRQSRTRCEYSYDEPTKRISIKVYDEDTDELIREVPPEESLEVLQKVWELAGIIVDKKL